MVRRAQTKTTAPLHKNHTLWKAGGEAQAGGDGVRRGEKRKGAEKCDGEDGTKLYCWLGSATGLPVS